MAKPRSTFDDTDLDDTISSGLSSLDGEERYTPFTTDYDRPSLELLKAVDAGQCALQHGACDVDDNKLSSKIFLPEGWQEIVQTERELQARSSCPSSIVEAFNNGRQMYLQENQWYGVQDKINSPSQGGRYDLQGPEDQVNGEDQKDGEAVVRTPSRTRSNQMPPPSPPHLKMTSTFETTSVPTSKSSSYVGIFGDDTPETEPATKKVRIELDYDPLILKSMSYADLNR